MGRSGRQRRRSPTPPPAAAATWECARPRAQRRPEPGQRSSTPARLPPPSRLRPGTGALPQAGQTSRTGQTGLTGRIPTLLPPPGAGPECARPRAQQRPQPGQRSGTPARLPAPSLLRPVTGALRGQCQDATGRRGRKNPHLAGFRDAGRTSAPRHPRERSPVDKRALRAGCRTSKGAGWCPNPGFGPSSLPAEARRARAPGPPLGAAPTGQAPIGSTPEVRLAWATRAGKSPRAMAGSGSLCWALDTAAP